jgi:hypothetical protein
MAEFTDVASKVRPPEGIKLTDMMSLATQGLQYQKMQELYPELIAKAKAESESSQLDTRKKRETIDPEIAKLKAGVQKDFFSTFGTIMGGYINDPRIKSGDPKKTVQALLEVKKSALNAGVPEDYLEAFISPTMSIAAHNPRELPQHVSNIIQSGLGSQGQQNLQTPSYTTNAAGNIIGIKPLTGELVAPGSGSGAPTVQSNVQGGGSNAPVARQTGLSLNPSTAEAGFVNKGAETFAIDKDITIKNAVGANDRIAVFQNIKKLAPDAFTGTGAGRKELVAGIANAIGMEAYELEKVATEELSKNSALLALTGGNTDAARAIAEIANPNKKMNEATIKRVANQMIGIENMKLAKADYLADVMDNPNAYGRKLATFNKYADFRLFQEMTSDDVAKMKATMSESEIKAMSEKIKKARELGIIK